MYFYCVVQGSMPPVGQNPLGLGFGQSLPGYGGEHICCCCLPTVAIGHGLLKQFLPFGNRLRSKHPLTVGALTCKHRPVLTRFRQALNSAKLVRGFNSLAVPNTSPPCQNNVHKQRKIVSNLNLRGIIYILCKIIGLHRILIWPDIRYPAGYPTE